MAPLQDRGCRGAQTMETDDETGAKDAGTQRLDAIRAAELVNRIRDEKDQPFGPLRLVRAVIRPRRQPTA